MNIAAHALAWTLIHFLWEGTLIAFALVLAIRFSDALSARFRYALASVAMLSLLAAFGVTLWQMWPRTPVLVHEYSLLARRAATTPMTSANIPQSEDEGRLLWLAWVWMLGVCGFSLHTLMSWAAAQRLRRIGICLAPEPWRSRLHALTETIGLSQAVSLYESALAEVPVVIGLLRPVILVPVGLLANFPAEQVEYFLIHELAHIRRYDYLVNLLQSLAEDLLFYHPAVWWVSGLIREERENCCDDIVRAHGNAHNYAAALVALEHNRWSGRETALAVNGGHLMNRIKRLLDRREASRSLTASFVAGGVLAGILMLGSFAFPIAASKIQAATAAPVNIVPPPVSMAGKTPRPTVQLAQAQRNPVPAQPPLQTGAFQKWLDEDVTYIVTSAERSEFLSLTSDAEREEFVDQFWQRRDPTPGTGRNEYKEEHYRRIAAANQRFGGRIPGWQTDRGRIYITFGPPDEIDSHPAGGPNSSLPYEDWRYRFIQGIGNDVNLEFVDSTGTGDYRMTMDPSEKDSIQFQRPQ